MNRRFLRLAIRISALLTGVALAGSLALVGAAAASAMVNCGCRTTTSDQSMVFTRPVNGVKQVFKADQNLTHVTQLTSGANDSSAPSFNTARTVIAYMSMVNKHLALMAMNADGTNQHVVVSDNVYNYWAPSISPDGTKAVVVSNRASGSELFVVTLSNGALTQLTHLGTAEGNNWAPAWSPNGQYIAFTSDRAAGNLVNIWLMPAGGGSAQKVTYDGHADDAAWSPSGNEIAFDFLAPGTSVREVYTAQAFSANTLIKVSTTDGAAHFDPTWSPDGSAIAFTSADSTGPNIKVAGAGGANPHTVFGGQMANWGFPIQGPVAQQ